MEDFDCPAQSLDLIQHLLNELELYVRPSHPVSLTNITYAAMAEWEQISAARFPNLMESLKRTVGAVIAA